MGIAVKYATEAYPVGAYAVDRIDYEIGANGGLPAVAVTIAYRHSPMEIRTIREVSDSGEAAEEIVKALKILTPAWSCWWIVMPLWTLPSWCGIMPRSIRRR